jgi:hypothetical protein
MPLTMPRLASALACLSALTACGGPGTSALKAQDVPAVPGTAAPGAPAPGAPASPSAPSGPGWVTVAQEDFEALELGTAAWEADREPRADDGPYGDLGAYFTRRGVSSVPAAYRLSKAFGAGGWLTVDSYTRDPATPFASLLSVVPDPANPANKVLRLASPAHTDATVIRSTQPLPDRYRASVRVGFARFGDGLEGANGYPATLLSAGPWRMDTYANSQNGFYWLAVLDAKPGPHNNTWIHHHRKVVMDSDNNFPAWTQIFDGQAFVPSGVHPVTMLAIDGRGPRTGDAGAPFIAYGGGRWQPSGTTSAIDAYLDREWYTVAVERSGSTFTLEVSGRFQHGGEKTYRATIDAAANCVWHFNRSAAEDASACVDETPLPGLDKDVAGAAAWAAGQVWPDWLMFGDPHENFYAGEVFYDDVKLEVWRP